MPIRISRWRHDRGGPAVTVPSFSNAGFAISRRTSSSVRAILNSDRHIWVFSDRITFYPSGIEPKGSGTTAYAWFVWDKQAASSQTELKWLRPGYRAQFTPVAKRPDSTASSFPLRPCDSNREFAVIALSLGEGRCSLNHNTIKSVTSGLTSGPKGDDCGRRHHLRPFHGYFAG
jgi:hypothetical protein